MTLPLQDKNIITGKEIIQNYKNHKTIYKLRMITKLVILQQNPPVLLLRDSINHHLRTCLTIYMTVYYSKPVDLFTFLPFF